MKKFKKSEIIDEIKNANFGLDVSAYDAAIENSGELIADMFDAADVLSMVTISTGHKANTIVQRNVISTNIVGSNSNCVTDRTEQTVIAPRKIQMRRLAFGEPICLDDLDEVLPQIQSAGAKNESLPFANLYVDMKLNEIAHFLPKLAWQGDESIVSGNLNLANGWLKQMDSETSDLAYFSSGVTAFTTSNAIAVIDTLLDNRSEKMFEDDNLVLFLDHAKFSILRQALVAAYGIYGAGEFVNTGSENQAGKRMFFYPGTTIRVYADSGLNGNGSIVLANPSNLVMLTDLVSDKDNVDLFFDKKSKSLISDIVFTAGFSYDFPGNIGYIRF